MSFQFDEQATLTHMAHAASVDLWNGQLTLYAVVCVGSDDEPHASHGGQVCSDANEALESAGYLNDLGHDCHYLPMALGCHPETLIEVAGLVSQPPEDVL